MKHNKNKKKKKKGYIEVKNQIKIDLKKESFRYDDSFIGDCSDLDLFYQESIDFSDKTIDKLNLKYIDTFLEKNKIKNLSDLKSPFCVQNQKIKEDIYKDVEKDEVKCHFLEEPLFSAVYALIIYILFIFSDSSKEIDVFNFIYSFFYYFLKLYIPLFIIIFIVLYDKYYYRITNDFYTENIKLVCIGFDEVEKVYRDKFGVKRFKMYKPYYYLKYNDLGYVIFQDTFNKDKVPKIGEINSDFYINKKNPLDFDTANSFLGLIILEVIFLIIFFLIFY